MTSASFETKVNPAEIKTAGSAKYEGFFGGHVQLDHVASSMFSAMGAIVPELSQGIFALLDRSAGKLPETLRSSLSESLQSLASSIGVFAPTIIELLARLELKDRFGKPVEGLTGAAEVAAGLANDEGGARLERLTAAQRVELATQELQRKLYTMATLLLKEEARLQAEIADELARTARITQVGNQAPGVAQIAEYSSGIVKNRVKQLQVQKDSITRSVSAIFGWLGGQVRGFGSAVLNMGQDTLVRMPNATKAIPVGVVA